MIVTQAQSTEFGCEASLIDEYEVLLNLSKETDNSKFEERLDRLDIESRLVENSLLNEREYSELELRDVYSYFRKHFSSIKEIFKFYEICNKKQGELLIIHVLSNGETKGNVYMFRERERVWKFSGFLISDSSSINGKKFRGLEFRDYDGKIRPNKTN